MRQQEKLSYQSVHTYVKALISFYEMNDIVLNKRKIGRYLGEKTRRYKDRAYTIAEIRNILEVCDLRTKVIVLLLTSTAMRIGALTDLKLSNLEKWDKNNIDTYKITVYENTKDEYYCFCTPECAKVINAYLQYRESRGEKLTANSPLIREQFHSEDPIKIAYPKKLSTLSMGDLVHKALVASGVRKVMHKTEQNNRIERQDVARAHGFRKFAITNMIRAQLNPVIREILSGHKPPGMDDNYFRPEPDDVFCEFLKVVDLQTVSEENRLRIKVEELAHKTRESDYIINARLQEKDEKIKSIELQYSSMQSQLQTLLSAVTNMNDQKKIDEFAKTLFDSGIVKAATHD